MGLQLPKRLRRAGLWALLAPALIALSACSQQSQDEWKRVALPQGATDRTDSVTEFWQWTWLTAICVGVFVWGLIIFAVVKYRRRDDDEVPVQTRYNLPMELLYTIAPVIVVLVFFRFIIGTQQIVKEPVDKPEHDIIVVGQQWSWTFNYVADPALDGKTTVFQPGTGEDIPTLYLPVNESVHFDLRSADVIHSFWVPAFIYKLDVIPGKKNQGFSLTPTRTGKFVGRCAELCGTYHSRMLFNVEVVSAQRYAEVLQQLKDRGNVGTAVGGKEVTGSIDGGDDAETGVDQ